VYHQGFLLCPKYIGPLYSLTLVRTIQRINFKKSVYHALVLSRAALAVQKDNCNVIKVPLTDLVNYVFMISGFSADSSHAINYCSCSRQSSLNVSRERKYLCSACCIVGMYTNLDLLFAAKTVIFVSMKSILCETELNRRSRSFTSRGVSANQSIYFYSSYEVKLPHWW